MKFYRLLMLFPLVWSCKNARRETAGEVKWEQSVKISNAARYEEFLTVLKACLADPTTLACTDHLTPGVILPLQLEGGERGQQANNLKMAFNPKPLLVKCDSVKKACSLILKRKEGASDLVIKTDSDVEDLSELIFAGDEFRIKMRLILVNDDENVGSKIEICRIDGLSATKWEWPAAKIDRVVMSFDKKGKLLSKENNGVAVFIKNLLTGSEQTEECDLADEKPK